MDCTYKIGKSALAAEYTKAGSSVDNKAYAFVFSYGFNDRLSVSVTGFRVENSGSMGGQSDFDAGNRGFHYGLRYKFSDSAASKSFTKISGPSPPAKKNSKL